MGSVDILVPERKVAERKVERAKEPSPRREPWDNRQNGEPARFRGRKK